MRPSARIIVALLFAAGSISAQTEHVRLSLFSSDLGEWHTTNSSGVTGGGGIALAYEPTQAFAVELSVASERHLVPVTRFLPTVMDGQTILLPATSRENYRTYPIDLLARYSLLNSTRFTPFTGAGFHHVTAPDTHPSGIEFPVAGGDGTQVVREGRFSDSNKVEVIAGVSMRLTRALSFDAGVRRLLTSGREQNSFDPRTRVILGLGYRF